MVNLIYFVLGLVMLVGVCLWNSVALMLLWKWFLVSLSPDIPMISLVQAIELFLISFIAYQHIPKEDGEELAEMMINGVKFPFFLIVVGFITRLIMGSI